MRVVNDSANRQSLIYGIGDMHIDVAASKLKERYKVDIELMQPKVAFRETIRKNSDVDSKYKKQSGGHGQYGHVKMRFEPSGDLETPYVFEEEVVGGSVPKNYFPAVEKGLAEFRSVRTAGRLPGRRRKGRPLRWFLPSGRLLRNGLQDRFHPGLQEGLHGRRDRSFWSRSSP